MTSARRPARRPLAQFLGLVVFPSFCRLCGSLLENPEERVVCRRCLGRAVPRRGPSCFCCGRFFAEAGEGHLCGRCLAEPPPFTRHRSAGRYEGTVKDLILLFKYGGFSPLARDLAAFIDLALSAETGFLEGVEAIVPVPLDRRRKRDRGFNQAYLIARHLGRLRGLAVLDRRLVKVRATAPQVSLEAAERERNVRGVYDVRKPADILARTVLLLDDVFTTGSTLRECSAVLMKAGAAEVRALTVAQA